MWTHVGFNLNGYHTSYSDRAARGGPAIRQSTSQSFWSGIQSDSRRQVTGGLWAGGGKSDEGRSFYAYIEPNVDFRLSSRFSASLGMGYNRNGDATQFYSQ